ncbi:TlpA family protein disulfide reductase [Mucilaginibacter sp. SMC90]|uniref:TlpA disulfide reductase family protein n=1 Tax=Mucilaginibacter sp. SMC90 TaxID=2929803 RepID=UPI001FB48F92|nr:TlpA disulfide reductase family protein [Mucilaginibacter sp. SMC90]UOE47378.1 TlpA family protein disulfide reductase [Mucilaginibacter sp. SMC90]
MKPHKSILLLPALLAVQCVFAQSNHLSLSSNYPTASEKVQFTYTSKDSPLAGKKDISAQVYFLDGKDYPVTEVALKPSGNALTGEFEIPATAKAFFIKVYSGADIDNNNDKGYMYEVYKDKKPVPGAFEEEAYVISSNLASNFGKIKADNDRAFELLKKEHEVYPTGEKKYDGSYYWIMAKKASPATKALMKAKVKLLEKSDNEKDLNLASSILGNLNEKTAADSLKKVIKAKFPAGEIVKNEAIYAMVMEKELGKRDSIYKDFESKFPGDKDRNVDYVRTQLAIGYLNAGNQEAFEKYVAMIQNKSALANGYNNIAYNWAVKGEKLEQAEKLSRQSLDIALEKQKSAEPSPFYTKSEVEKRGKDMYNTYEDSYAYILYREKKYNEALKYQKEVYEYDTENDPTTNEHYVLILNALGKYAESKAVIEKAFKAAKVSPVLKEELKKAYVGLKGSEAGYDQYLAGLSDIARDKKREEVAKQMINQPATKFALKDFAGNTVSLADLKGKIVIVDFWATWCGPCKASFPGMQMAVNKYKDDQDVKFLFIDTWENGDSYIDGVKKFIADSKYTFNVLIDEKGGDGRQSKVVTQFGVTGIPTKFIIDKSGNIRFKVVGFDGSAEGLVDEVSTMIDMAKGPVTAEVAVAPKQSMK